MDGLSGGNDQGLSFKINTEGIPSNLVILYNHSTAHIFYNCSLLTKIGGGYRCMDIHRNTGVSYTNLIGDMQCYPGLIWYNPKRLANIHSMVRVEKHLPITYGTEKCFIVHRYGGSKNVFVIFEWGLYYMDTAAPHTNKHKEEIQSLVVNSGVPDKIKMKRRSL